MPRGWNMMQQSRQYQGPWNPAGGASDADKQQRLAIQTLSGTHHDELRAFYKQYGRMPSQDESRGMWNRLMRERGFTAAAQQMESVAGQVGNVITQPPPPPVPGAPPVTPPPGGGGAPPPPGGGTPPSQPPPPTPAQQLWTILPEGIAQTLPDGTIVMKDGRKILPDGTLVSADGTQTFPPPGGYPGGGTTYTPPTGMALPENWSTMSTAERLTWIENFYASGGGGTIPPDGGTGGGGPINPTPTGSQPGLDDFPANWATMTIAERIAWLEQWYAGGGGGGGGTSPSPQATIPQPQEPWRQLPEDTPAPAWYSNLISGTPQGAWRGPSNLRFANPHQWRNMSPSEKSGLQGLAETMGVHWPDYMQAQQKLWPSWGLQGGISKSPAWW
uniref:Uncharacterized protein n=2 Tax=viral metagenome TaxID=1070528 RepID=A0A6H1ZQW6_9ZZZZ